VLHDDRIGFVFVKDQIRDICVAGFFSHAANIPEERGAAAAKLMKSLRCFRLGAAARS
jgi:hypothetical protein